METERKGSLTVHRGCKIVKRLRWRGSFRWRRASGVLTPVAATNKRNERRHRSTIIRCRGFLFAELIVSMALLGLIIAGLAVSMNGFAMVNDYQWARQRCTAAAQAQLDCIAATGRLIEPPELQHLWPGVDVSLERSPGAVPWEGLELIQATATAQPGSRKVTVHLARYVGRVSTHAGESRAVHGVPVGNFREERSEEREKVRSQEGEKALRPSPVPTFLPSSSVAHGVTTNAAEGGRS